MNTDMLKEPPSTKNFGDDIHYNLNVTFMDTLGTSWEVSDIEPNSSNPEYIPMYKFISIVRIEYEQEWTAWQKATFDCHNKVTPRKIRNLFIPISEIKGILTGYDCDGTYMCRLNCGRYDSKGGYTFHVLEPLDMETMRSTVKILCRLMK